MSEAPCQYELAICQLHLLLLLAVEHPGAIASLEELRLLILAAADELERHGDYGAARILEKLIGPDGGG